MTGWSGPHGLERRRGCDGQRLADACLQRIEIDKSGVHQPLVGSSAEAASLWLDWYHRGGRMKSQERMAFTGEVGVVDLWKSFGKRTILSLIHI